MRITIPSKGRIGAQLTWWALPPAVREEFKVVVVCEPDEVGALMRGNINAIAWKPRKGGIGAKRQWIMENFDDKLLCMFDDDLSIWATRVDGYGGNKTKYLKATGDDIHQGLIVFGAMLEDNAAGAIGGRSFAQDRPRVMARKHGRLVRALGYNRAKMPTAAKFRMATCEDLDMQLQLLTAGCDLFLYNGIVQEQKGSNLPGGCSEYRDLEFQAGMYAQLHKYHPDFVKLVQRTYRKGWEGMDKTQPSVTINWRAAAAYGKRSIV